MLCSSICCYIFGPRESSCKAIRVASACCSSRPTSNPFCSLLLSLFPLRLPFRVFFAIVLRFPYVFTKQ